MDKQFWEERWQAEQIGFHLDKANPSLVRYIKHLEPKEGETVFVPLCGKSNDLLYLAGQKLKVIGVEIVKKAVEDFFNENNISFEKVSVSDAEVYHSDLIDVWHCDALKLHPDFFPSFELLYDRASLIALPPAMREEYAAMIGRISEPGTRQLLINLEYDQSEMSGPPFSVNGDEISRLYGENWKIEDLHSEDIISKEPRFMAKGLSRFVEEVRLLTRRP